MTMALPATRFTTRLTRQLRVGPLGLQSLSARQSARPSSSSSSNASSSSLPPGTSADPSHPHLYYHALPSPPSAPSRIALSFLPRSPIAGSRTVIGYLPPVPDAGLNDFSENPSFLPLLHSAIKDGLEKNKAPGLEFEAATRPGDGYIHITDERALPPAGRIGETEDLIGTVFVQEGKVVPSTYEPLPSYRLVTTEGVLKLPRGLSDHVVEYLSVVDAVERE